MSERIINYTPKQLGTIANLHVNGFNRSSITLSNGTVLDETYFDSEGTKIELDYRFCGPVTYTWKD